MLIEFTQSVYADYTWWLKHHPKKAERIQTLLRDISERPFQGMGKPEPLKFDLQGYWSRRIDQTNRLVYSVNKRNIMVISCRFHYGR